MRIYVKTISGKIIEFDFTPSYSIKNIKDKIYEKEGIPQEQQMIIFAGRKLEDNLTLLDYNIQEGYSLGLILKQFIKISINIVSGKSIELYFKPSYSIKNIKDKIYEIECIPPEKQIIIFAGKELDDNLTLLDYNVKEGSSLGLIIRNLIKYL